MDQSSPDERSRQPQADPPPAAGAAEVRAGDITQLFQQHNCALVAFLARRLNNEAEARDVAQEAYVRMLQLDRPDTPSFLRAYLYRVASNIAVDRIRHRAVTARLDPPQQAETLVDDLAPERELIAREDLQVFQQALLELPQEYRRAFQLSRFMDQSTEEIAAALGVGSWQTRVYLRRALAYCQLRIDGLNRAEARKQAFA